MCSLEFNLIVIVHQMQFESVNKLASRRSDERENKRERGKEKNRGGEVSETRKKKKQTKIAETCNRE